MTRIIMSAAALVGMLPFTRKNSGTPMSAPLPKQINCLLVRLNITFVFTRVRSLGMST